MSTQKKVTATNMATDVTTDLVQVTGIVDGVVTISADTHSGLQAGEVNGNINFEEGN